MKKAVILILIFSLLSLTACNKEEEEEVLETVRLNEVVHSIFYAPQYVAMEKGFFEEEGLLIKLSTGQGADKTMTALLADSADIALLGAEAGLYVINEGKEDYPLSFAQLTQTAGNFLVSREDEKDFTWDDLKGKTVIGGRAGGMPQIIFEYILKKNGLDPASDLEILTNLQFESTAGAFVSGEGDYTVEFEPTASSLEAQGNGYVVASLGSATDYIPYTVYMANPSYLKDNKETVQKFTNAIYKAQVWINENSSEEIAKVVLPHFPESDIESLAKIISRYKEQNTWKENPIFDKTAFELLQDILEDGKTLEKRVDFDKIVDNSFAENVLK